MYDHALFKGAYDFLKTVTTGLFLSQLPDYPKLLISHNHSISGD